MPPSPTLSSRPGKQACESSRQIDLNFANNSIDRNYYFTRQCWAFTYTHIFACCFNWMEANFKSSTIPMHWESINPNFSVSVSVCVHVILNFELLSMGGEPNKHFAVVAINYLLIDLFFREIEYYPLQCAHKKSQRTVYTLKTFCTARRKLENRLTNGRTQLTIYCTGRLSAEIGSLTLHGGVCIMNTLSNIAAAESHIWVRMAIRSAKK